MPIKTVGILSPGDMGQAIAVVLSQQGLRTIAALDDGSEHTRKLAAAATIHEETRRRGIAQSLRKQDV